MIDTSTVRRVHPQWVYGLPEMSAEQRAAISQARLVARLDNLGKGAAGNAIQCLNLMLGFDEYTGLGFT